MSRTRDIQQLWTYKFAQGRKTIETTKIKKNYQKMCKNARVLLFEVTSTENRKLGETGASVKKILYTHKPKPGHFGWSGGRKYSQKNLGKLLGRPPFHF